MSKEHDGVRLHPTACPNLFVGRPVSMLVEGRPTAWHRTWSIYGRDDSGEISGPLGLPYDTRAEARLHAEVVRCADWDDGVHPRRPKI